jgi:LmbE family N-acetylglucosaminyl deacetylase
MQMKKRHIIVAPHADDEIIGCHGILFKEKDVIVLFHKDAIEEGRKVYENIPQIKVGEMSELYHMNTYNSIIHFPDPYFELHPLHRSIGAIGEALWRAHTHEVHFYSTNMNAPYIREYESMEDKQYMLNRLYPGKASLWAYDHKYFLFEGRVAWQID